MKIVKASDNSLPVRLRKEPNGQVLAKISQGTKVEVLSTKDDWCEIKIPDGQVGWMMTKYLVNEKSDLSELKQKLKEALALLDKLED